MGDGAGAVVAGGPRWSWGPGGQPWPGRRPIRSSRWTSGRWCSPTAGGGGLEPESTVPAFENVQRHFPDAVIELDVHETRDGEIVVIHDDTVDRTTNGRGAVEKLTLSELQALDAGYCFSPDAPDGTLDRRACRRAEAVRVPRRGRGYRIPTLAEVLTALRPSEQPGAPRSRLSVEVKSAGIEERVATLLRARWPLDRLAVGAIKGPVAARLAALLPEAAHYAPLANTACHLAQARAGWLPGDCARHQIIAVPAKNLFSSPALARYAHERGMAVASFTANDEATIERVIRRGVDAVITDFPDRAARVIQRLRGSQQGPQAPAAVVAGAAPAGDQPLRIDAHCHVFNGEDLALQGFVQKVILHEEKLYPGLLRPISLLVTSYVRLFADSYRQEARATRPEDPRPGPGSTWTALAGPHLQRLAGTRAAAPAAGELRAGRGRRAGGTDRERRADRTRSGRGLSPRERPHAHPGARAAAPRGPSPPPGEVRAGTVGRLGPPADRTSFHERREAHEHLP